MKKIHTLMLFLSAAVLVTGTSCSKLSNREADRNIHSSVKRDSLESKSEQSENDDIENIVNKSGDTIETRYK